MSRFSKISWSRLSILTFLKVNLDDHDFLDSFKNGFLTILDKDGQSAARGLHAALETFFAVLEFKGDFKYYIPHPCKRDHLKCHFWRKFWLFETKNDIFEEHFWKFSKKLNPSTPLRIKLRRKELKKLLKMIKKVWPLLP
jgi:hypothetical protein